MKSTGRVKERQSVVGARGVDPPPTAAWNTDFNDCCSSSSFQPLTFHKYLGGKETKDHVVNLCTNNLM